MSRWSVFRSGHLYNGIQSTAVMTACGAIGSLIRIPLTVSAIGVAGYGVVATICALFGWVAYIAAGARTAAGAAAASTDGQALGSVTIASLVTRSTLRVALPIIGLLALLSVVVPWNHVIDRSGVFSALSIRLVLLGAVALGIAAVWGAAVLGALTTRVRFREQNLATIGGVFAATGLVALACWRSWGPEWFALAWAASLAVPGLPASLGWFASRRRRQEAAARGSAPDTTPISAHSLWIAAGQQFASGFDLVIISALLGSREAAVYGLTTRLIQIALTPVIGASPVIVRYAGLARVAPTAENRAHVRRLLAIVVGGQLACVVAIGAASPWLSQVLGGNGVRPPLLLVLSVIGWACVETVRRAMMAATSTVGGLGRWRVWNLTLALPNVCLSVALTPVIGMSGPMIGSLIASVLMMSMAYLRLGGDVREVALA